MGTHLFGSPCTKGFLRNPLTAKWRLCLTILLRFGPRQWLVVAPDPPFAVGVPYSYPVMTLCNRSLNVAAFSVCLRPPTTTTEVLAWWFRLFLTYGKRQAQCGHWPVVPQCRCRGRIGGASTTAAEREPRFVWAATNSGTSCPALRRQATTNLPSRSEWYHS